MENNIDVNKQVTVEQPVVAPAPVVDAPVAPAPVADPTVAPATPAPATPGEAIAKPTIESENRQEQWDKLLESNKRLYEANELLRGEMQKRTQSQQQFQPLQQTPTAPVAAVPNPNDFIEVDPTTGEKFINESKLQTAIKESNDRAVRAESTVQNYIQQSEQREIERQNKETFASYPDLNPSDKSFDLKFHQQVRGLLYDSMVNPQDYGGRPLDFKAAADFIKGTDSKKASAPVKAEAPVGPTPEQIAAQTAKTQASQAATPTPQAQEDVSSEESRRALASATRYGDDAALAQRLLNTDHIRKNEENS